MTIVSSLKHKNIQPLYIFNRENPQNSEPQNGPRSGLDYIALITTFLRDHPFKMSACLRGGGVSPWADGQKVIVQMDQKFPSKAF